MLTAEQMRTLKKVNISADPVKTKTRIAEDFKTTTNPNKKLIVELSGLKRPTFYRVFDTGAATARVILSIAQVLGVSPYYYTGRDDEKSSLSDEILIEFLERYKYDRLVQELNNQALKKQKRQYTRKPKAESFEPEYDEQIDDDESEYESLEQMIFNEAVTEPEKPAIVSDEISPNNISLDSSQKMQEAVESLDEESAELLLKALFKRAEAGENAKVLCDLVKRCLLS